MNIFKRTTTADKIVDKMDRLTAKRQRLIDEKNVKNSAIENKMKSLEYKSWSNQVSTDSKCNVIDRQLDKLKRDLKSEKEYVNSVVPSEDKPRNITSNREAFLKK